MKENKKAVTSYKTWKRICLICIFTVFFAFLSFITFYSAYAPRGDFDSFINSMLHLLPYTLPMLIIGTALLFTGKLKSKTGKRILSILFLICLAIEVCIWFLPITGSLSMNLRPIGIFVILAHLVMIFSFIKYIKALDKKYMKEPVFSGWAVFAIFVVLCLLVGAWIFILMNS